MAMKAITWNSAMSVGVKALDADHKALIGMINDLDQAITTNETLAVIVAIVHRLVDYTDYHFEREEAMMRACGYPGFEMHCLEHRAIKSRIRDFRRTFDDNVIGGADRRLMAFMLDWLRNHILKSDINYRPFLIRKSGASKRPSRSRRRAPAKRPRAGNRARKRERLRKREKIRPSR